MRLYPDVLLRPDWNFMVNPAPEWSLRTGQKLENGQASPGPGGAPRLGLSEAGDDRHLRLNPDNDCRWKFAMEMAMEGKRCYGVQGEPCILACVDTRGFIFRHKHPGARPGTDQGSASESPLPADNSLHRRRCNPMSLDP